MTDVRPDVSVRPARPDDALAVATVQLSTWRTAYADLLPESVLDAPVEELAAAWRRSVELPPSAEHRLLVALEGTEVVGFAAYGPGEAAGQELTALLVEPLRGRRGHGSRLLAAVVEHWRSTGAETAQTWVWDRDAVTRAFLGSAGWAADGAAQGLDTGDAVHRQVRLHTALGPA